MIAPQYTVTVNDTNLTASFDSLPRALRAQLRGTISTLTHSMLGQVRAREPVRTGGLRARTRAYVDEGENFIRGRVKVVGSGRQLAAAGAQEYGAHRPATVPGYTRGGARVRGYIRRTNTRERRFLRDPGRAMRARALAEITRVVEGFRL